MLQNFFFWLPKLTLSHKLLAAWYHCYKKGALIAFDGNISSGKREYKKSADDVHRAIRIQAAQHGRSTEAEIRDILERAARAEGLVKLGSFLVSIARKVGGLTDEEHALIKSARIKSSARAVSFE